MKNKLVIWSKNAANEKVLLAFELKAEESKVILYVFPQEIVTDAFVDQMMDTWRDNKGEVEFPAGYQTIEREISITESLLPEEYKVERPDILQRAQAEWHFDILSAKLHAAYQQELAEFKEKIEALTAYDNKLFASLRTFWDKIQNQSRDRNLYYRHADNLRDRTRELFDQLKALRERANNEFNEVSKTAQEKFNAALLAIEERIASGSGRNQIIFEELKKLQREYYTARMSNEHRNQIWDRIDAAFKKARERRFGPEANDGSVAERHDRRAASLNEAIKKLEDSLRRDDEELAFQRQKVNTTEGQLEAQIRSAKIKMIEERTAGKRERLAELLKTRDNVQRQADGAREREARYAAKEAERQQVEAKKAAIKSEIEAETHARAASGSTKPAGEKEDSLFDAATTVLGDVLIDALDTAKAVASVAAEKAEEAFEQIVEKAEEALESLKKDEAPAAEDTGLESVKQTENAESPEKADGIIIDDVVHKNTEEAPVATEEPAAKPKRTTKKKAAEE